MNQNLIWKPLNMFPALIHHFVITASILSGANIHSSTMEKYENHATFRKNITIAREPGKLRNFFHFSVNFQSSIRQKSVNPAHQLNWKTGNSLILVTHCLH